MHQSQSPFCCSVPVSYVPLFVTPWTVAYQAPLSSTNCQSLLTFISLRQWCHPTISSSVVPFSPHPQSFPASGSFPMSQLFPSGGQSIGASALATVLPMNTQGWFPLGLTGLISLQPKGLSRVFSSATVQKHQSPFRTSLRCTWQSYYSGSKHAKTWAVACQALLSSRGRGLLTRWPRQTQGPCLHISSASSSSWGRKHFANGIRASRLDASNDQIILQRLNQTQPPSELKYWSLPSSFLLSP